MICKFFRATTKIEGMSEQFVDWYNAYDEAEARADWEKEGRANGVPIEKATVEFVECDRKTLQPI